MNFWFVPPVPATHYLSPTSLRDGTSVCMYMPEPYEVAQQDFSTNLAAVTCSKCLDWIANDAARRLRKEAR